MIIEEKMADKQLKAYKKITWTVSNMTKENIERYEVFDEIESSSTEVLIGDNSTEWSLSFFPGGVTKGTRAYVGLCLVLIDADSTQFDVKYTLGVVGKEIVFTEAENTGEAFKSGWRWFKYLKRDDLFDPNKDFLTDGKLTIFCELKITATEVPKSDNSASFSGELLSHYKNLLKDGDCDYSDFKFKTADGKVLKGHKVILSISKFFAQLFTMTKTKDGVLKVSEDASIMKEILRFIYYHEVKNLKENAHELVFAAEKYELNELQKMCISSMIESLTTENVLQTLLTADRLAESNSLKKKCFDVIASNDMQVSDEWQSLPKRVLVEIICHLKDKDKDVKETQF